MAKQGLSKRKIEAISNGVFLVGLGLLFYTNFWWPGILLAIWAMLAVRQLLSKRNFDFIVSTVILGGIFVISYFQFNWDLILPSLFVLGGLYIIIREYIYSDDNDEQTG